MMRMVRMTMMMMIMILFNVKREQSEDLDGNPDIPIWAREFGYHVCVCVQIQFWTYLQSYTYLHIHASYFTFITYTCTPSTVEYFGLSLVTCRISRF